MGFRKNNKKNKEKPRPVINNNNLWLSPTQSNKSKEETTTDTPLREDCIMLTLTNDVKIELPIENNILTRSDVEPYRNKIKEIEIPNIIRKIGNSAFYSFKKLVSIKISDAVTEIGWGAFYKCESLTNVKIPENVTKIDDVAFFGCKNLTIVAIPSSVTYINYGAFIGCHNLKEIWLLEGSELTIRLPNETCQIRYYKKGNFDVVKKYLETQKNIKETRKNLEEILSNL